MINRFQTTLGIVLACLYLVGCASSPDRSAAPDIETPATWTTTVSSTQPNAWLDDLNRPELNSLVKEALQNNSDLQITAARFNQAIAEARIAGADQLPTAGLGLNGTRQKISTFGPSSTGGVRFENYDLSLNVNWELDLWGRLRNRTSAAIAQLEASQADFQAARLSLAAQVTKRWFDYTEAAQQLALAEKTAKAYADNLQTIESRFKRGLSDGLEVRQIRTQKAFADSDIGIRRRALDQAARAVENLLGRYPSASLQASLALPSLPTSIPAGLPAELLSRRPDLIAAERQLAAADQQLTATRKELLPQISLTGSSGSSSQEFENLLDSDFSVWSIGGNLAQPIFQGGRILANIERSEALREQAIANYRATVLQAFLEVESTLAAERFLQQEQLQLALAAEEAQATEDLAWQRYRDGTADFINVLNSQRASASARSRLIGLRNLLLQNRIDLYLALGGPFTNES